MLRAPSIDDLQPREPAEAAAMLAGEALRSTPVVPVGSGSQIDRLPAGARLLWTRHLDHILDHQPDDLTITVQSGTPLAAIQRQLATARQHLPHRPSSAGAATIGGLLASHRPGLTRLGHGPLRDRVLGMTVALSSGELASSGGRVVKNVAGYDLHRLHVGAHGTLGVITQVTLKVSPLPSGRTLLVAPLADLDATARFAAELARSPLLPVAILASARFRGTGPGGVDLAGPLLWVAFEDVDAGRERAVRDAGELARAHGLPPFARHEVELPGGLADLSADFELELYACVPRSEGRLLLGAFAELSPTLVDLGEGVLRIALAADEFAAMLDLAAAVRAAGGWCAVVRALPALWPAIRKARPPVPAEPRMLALRRALDPAGIMHPGRLLEGLL